MCDYDEGKPESENGLSDGLLTIWRTENGQSICYTVLQEETGCTLNRKQRNRGLDYDQSILLQQMQYM